MINSLLPDEVKVNILIGGIRLGSNLTTDRTIRFTKNWFFYTILGFIESHSGLLSDIEGFLQILSGTYKSEEPIDITGIDKILLKANRFDGSIFNGVREPILY